METLLGSMSLVIILIIIALVVAAIVMPIVVIMIDGRVAKISKETKRTNQLLEQLIIAQHPVQPQPMQRAKPITKRYELPAA